MTKNLDYLQRINRGIDYIVNNLTGDLRLEAVARAAAFSPFHFHRIFRALVGETLNQFVKRVRLQRALALLTHRDELSLTDIALACGFASSSDFSRSFKKQFGVPPRAFDIDAFRASKRNDMQVQLTGPEDRHLLARLPVGENPDGFEVTLRELPARSVAYLRVHQPYEGTGVLDATNELIAWATERSVEGGQWLGYTWDDPEIVPLDKCRYDVGVEVAAPFADDAGVSCLHLPAMTVAEVQIKGAIDLEQRGLDWLFMTWLPTSGFAPAEQPCFEAWDGLPFTHGNQHFELRIHIPVVDASDPI